MRAHSLRLPLLMIGLLGACMALAAPPSYRLDYTIGFLPASGEATVEIVVKPDDGRLQRLRLSIDDARHAGFAGDGRIDQDDGKLTWRPPRDGGALRYRYKVDRQRRSGGFDARMTERWALLRADRLVPPAAALAPDRAVAIATLRFDLPEGWTNADTGYRFDPARDGYPIANPGRRFQRPLGWMIAGDVGTRRDQIDGMEVSVAAPRGAAMRRNDILAIVNVIAPEMRQALGRLPDKLLIVGADDPMWRGGLSGPNSLYMHADRPLISENGSSTLVHELVHVVSRIRGTRNNDWIAEGIAEFYSIELLRRTGLLAENRAERAFEWMQRRGSGVRTLHAKHSSGARTARAVTLIRALDEEIRSVTDSEKSIDDVVRPLVDSGRLSTARLREAAEGVLGRPSRVLRTGLLDP